MRVLKRPFVFLQRDTKFCSCTQTVICFLTAKCKILKTVPKRPFIFHSERRNLELYANYHSLFDYKIRNCSERFICFLTKNAKIKTFIRFLPRNTKSHTQTAICFFTKNNKNRTLVLVLFPQSFDYLPSYQIPTAK